MAGKNNYQSERVSMSPVNLLKIRILQRRDFVINYIETYYLQKGRGVNSSVTEAQLKASIKSLYVEIQQAFENDVERSKKFKDNGQVESIKIKIQSNDVKDIIEAFSTIDNWLYVTKKITQFDTNKSYDVTDPIEEDEVRGL